MNTAFKWLKTISNHKRRLISFLLIMCIIGVSVFIALKSFPRIKHKSEPSPKNHYGKDMAATGLSFVEFEDSRKKFSFKIKKIEVSKKKLGFLRLGFFKVSEINDFEMCVYLDSGKKTGLEKGIDVEKYLLGSEGVHSMALESIKELKIHNFSAKFLRGGVLTASIKSDKADLIVYQKNFEFSGNVILQAENGRILKCQTMVYLRDDKKFQTKGSFRLISGQTVIEGKGMLTDLFLENIDYDISSIKKTNTEASYLRLRLSMDGIKPA